jgi:diguanylate cyclase (GGDEF)-like protein
MEGFRAHLQSANAALTTGDYARCVAEATRLHADALAACDLAVAADAALVLAKVGVNQSKAGEAERWARQSVQLAQTAGATDTQAVAWVVLASAHALHEQPHDTVSAIDKAMALVRDDMPGDTRRAVFTGIGLSYQSMGLTSQALAVLRQSQAQLPVNAPAGLRVRVRVNVFYAAADVWDQLVLVDAAVARALIEEMLAQVPVLEADAAQAATAHARAAFLHSAGTVLYRAGQVDRALAFFSELHTLDIDATAEVRREGLTDLAYAQRAAGQAAAARDSAERAQATAPFVDEQLRAASDLLAASQLAELLGDTERSLALHRRYHARVTHNERAAFEARVAELTATVASQSMRLEIVDLRQRNAGLADTFKQLSDLALRDPLTGVANRRGLAERFAALAAAGKRMSMALIDLDHFKQVNDRFSHQIGDEVLRRVALMMGEVLRAHDCVGRFGGEEFVALLCDTNLPASHAATERLRERVQAHDWSAVAVGLAVTLSGGVVDVRPGEGFDAAFARADALLYAAKAAGRNRVIAEDA